MNPANFALLLNQPRAVFHVPAERAEEGIQEIIAELGFHVRRFFEFGKSLTKRFHEPIQLFFKILEAGARGHWRLY